MLALIAGQGALPAAVAAALDVRPLVCALSGFEPDSLRPEITFRVEHLGSFLADLKARGVTRVCLCGRVGRPAIDLAALDQATLPLVPILRDALQQGDDGALRAVMGLIEAQGIDVIGAHEAAPGLLMQPGIPTRAEPDAQMRTDAALGDAALAEMGQADLGQACIIRAGRVELREAEDGTDALLLKAGALDAAGDPFNRAVDAAADLLGEVADWLSGPDGTPPAARKGALFKGPKPGQDRRADLPTIGPDTVSRAMEAGLAGLIIEAGGVIVLDQPRVLKMLDDAGMFLWVRERPGA